MANVIYNSFKSQATGTFNWTDNVTTTIKVMLVTSAYIPDIDTHTIISNVTNEVVGTGYTAGGKELLTRTAVTDNAIDAGKHDADDIVWLASSITARGAVIYDAGTNNLIAYLDFVSDKISQSGDFNLIWNADGIFRII